MFRTHTPHYEWNLLDVFSAGDASGEQTFNQYMDMGTDTTHICLRNNPENPIFSVDSSGDASLYGAPHGHFRPTEGDKIAWTKDFINWTPTGSSDYIAAERRFFTESVRNGSLVLRPFQQPG